MPTPDVGPTGGRVAENVKSIRGRVPYREFASLLDRLGRPILPSGLLKLERGERRVDVDDLVALAIALGVSPNRLLLPVDDQNGRVSLTPAVSTTQSWAWSWANGMLMIARPGEGPVTLDDNAQWRRGVVPPWEQRYGSHTAMRAAEDLVDALREFLDRQQYGDHPREVDGDWVRQGTEEGLRRILRRVIAEVEALIGENDAGR